MKYLPRIEWEFLQKEKKISFIEKYSLNLDSINEMYLRRNEKYEILLEISGNASYNNIEEINKITGKIDFFIETRFEIFNCHACEKINSSISFPENKYDVTFKVQNINRNNKKYQGNEKVFIKEWYINSTRDGLIFNRGTKFNVQKEFIKIRDIPKNQELNIVEEYPPNSSLDSLFLNLNTFSVLLQKVPQIFGPDWSDNLGIEYQKELNIPSDNIREKLVEFISFLMGRYLIKIGETHYDEKWNIIEDFVQTPNIASKIDLKQICVQQDFNCINLYGEFLELNIEGKLSLLIIEYLNELELDLPHIIHQLLISMTLPVEAEIVMIGACLDKLTENWIHSSRSEHNGKLIEKDIFDELMGNYIEDIKDTFEDYPEVLKKIENSFQASGRQKVDFFLKELELEIGDVEDDARSYRNKPAHGHKLDEEKLFKLMYLTAVYRSLLNRIILKILNYQEYIDLTSWRVLPINEKLSEENYKTYVQILRENTK